MKRLFTDQPIPLAVFSFEQYIDVIKHSQTVSNESISGFLTKIQDSLVSTFNTMTMKYNDKAVDEVMSVRYQTLAKAKTLDFTVTSENLTSIPESFRGKYIKYIDDLKNTAKVSIPEVEKVLTDVKIVIATFVNDPSDDKIGGIYGLDTFKRAEKNLEKHQAEISKYFPANTGKMKASFRDILQTYDDFDKLFYEIQSMDTTFNYDAIKAIYREVENIRGLIDTLVTLTSTGSIEMKNERLKKELVFATYIAGKYVEFMSYLFTNILVFYSVFKNNCEDLIKL